MRHVHDFRFVSVREVLRPYGVLMVYVPVCSLYPVPVSLQMSDLSDVWYSSSESSTDEEYEARQQLLEEDKLRDEMAHEMWDFMMQVNICSPLLGPMDGAMLQACLYNNLALDDVVHKQSGRLRFKDKVALGDCITQERINDFRLVAKMMAQLYNPAFSQFSSYINSVTAGLIRYHYRL